MGYEDVFPVGLEAAVCLVALRAARSTRQGGMGWDARCCSSRGGDVGLVQPVSAMQSMQCQAVVVVAVYSRDRRCKGGERVRA